MDDVTLETAEIVEEVAEVLAISDLMQDIVIPTIAGGIIIAFIMIMLGLAVYACINIFRKF